MRRQGVGRACGAGPGFWGAAGLFSSFFTHEFLLLAIIWHARSPRARVAWSRKPARRQSTAATACTVSTGSSSAWQSTQTTLHVHDGLTSRPTLGSHCRRRARRPAGPCSCRAHRGTRPLRHLQPRVSECGGVQSITLIRRGEELPVHVNVEEREAGARAHRRVAERQLLHQRRRAAAAPSGGGQRRRQCYHRSVCHLLGESEDPAKTQLLKMHLLSRDCASSSRRSSEYADESESYTVPMQLLASCVFYGDGDHCWSGPTSLSLAIS